VAATERAIKQCLLLKMIVRQLPIPNLAQDHMLELVDDIYPEAKDKVDTVEWIESLSGSERLFDE
jgi:hypothetical protein